MEKGEAESLASHYDLVLNATIIEVPIDDLPLRTLTFTYTS